MQEIHAYMAHVMRAIVQGPMQDECMSEMHPKCVYIIIHWAMKCLAKYYREQQANFFAKAGRSFH